MSEIVPVSGSHIDPVALKNSMDKASATQQQKIDQAATQFEAIFLRQYLGDSLKPMFKGYLDESGSINDTYRYFLTDVLADRLASQKVFGLGNKLSEQLSVDEARRNPTEGAAAPATSLPKSPTSDIRAFSPSTTLGTPNAISSLETPHFSHFRL